MRVGRPAWRVHLPNFNPQCKLVSHSHVSHHRFACTGNLWFVIAISCNIKSLNFHFHSCKPERDTEFEVLLNSLYYWPLAIFRVKYSQMANHFPSDCPTTMEKYENSHNNTEICSSIMIYVVVSLVVIIVIESASIL